MRALVLILKFNIFINFRARLKVSVFTPALPIAQTLHNLKTKKENEN